MAVAYVACAIEVAIALSVPVLPAHVVLPGEIQVYTGDISAPGRFGSELYVNATPSGIDTPNYPSGVTTPHGWRAMAEFSYGLTPSLELGFYVPTALMRESTFHVTGPKVRAKWTPMCLVGGVGDSAGINVELVHVVGRSETSQNATELRPAYGYQSDRRFWTVNPVLDWNPLGDGRSGVPEVAPSFETARTAATGVRAGTEYYVGFGPINHIAPLHEQQYTVLLASDIDRKPFVFNFGIGRGLTRVSDRWTLR